MTNDINTIVADLDAQTRKIAEGEERKRVLHAKLVATTPDMIISYLSGGDIETLVPVVKMIITDDHDGASKALIDLITATAKERQKQAERRRLLNEKRRERAAKAKKATSTTTVTKMTTTKATNGGDDNDTRMTAGGSK